MKEIYPKDFQEQILSNELIVATHDNIDSLIEDIRYFISQLTGLQINEIFLRHGIPQEQKKKVTELVRVISVLTKDYLNREDLDYDCDLKISSITGYSQHTILNWIRDKNKSEEIRKTPLYKLIWSKVKKEED